MDVTRSNKLITVLIFIFFITSLFLLANPVSAEDSVENIIEGDFFIEMDSATDFKINVEVDVERITRSGSDKTYTGSEIDSISSSNPYLLGAIAGELQITIKNTIKQSFENAKVTPLYDIPTYEDSKFVEKYTVNLTKDFFGLNETVNAHDFVNGLLDVGANIDYNFDLHSELGWNNTFTIELGKNIDYEQTNGVKKGNQIEWIVRNGIGLNPTIAAELKIDSMNPTTSSSDAEDIGLDFILNAEDRKTNLESNILTKKINIAQYNVLPEFVTNLTHLPADGIRLLIENGLLTWEDFNQTTIKPIVEKIKSNLKTTLFNQTLDFKIGWDDSTTINSQPAYEINNMDDNPSIKIIYEDDDVNLKIYDISSRAVFGLINSGAKANVTKNDVNFGTELSNIGYPYNITLMLPEGVFLQSMKNYTWNDTIEFSGDFESEDPPKYHNNKIKTVIEIEVESSDLNLLSFFSGNSELNFGINIREDKDINVTTLPSEFSLPNKISLEYLNSDALRLCIEEKVFSQDEVDNFLNNNKDSFRNRLNKKILPGLDASCKADKKDFEESLENWDNDITEMTDENPVRVSSYGNGIYPVPFTLNYLPPSADIPVKEINFSGIPDQEVTYRMIFPQGLSIDAEDVKGERVITIDKTKDGRYYFELTFTAAEHNLSTVVSCKMIPSTLFTIGLFMPCIISIIIVIILIIVVYMIRKKRKGRKPQVENIQEEPISGYEEEDYYVPPPPGGK